VTRTSEDAKAVTQTAEDAEEMAAFKRRRAEQMDALKVAREQPRRKLPPRRPIPDDLQDALRNAPTFELYSLEPEDGEREGEGFHGWKVLGRTVVRDAVARNKLADAFIAGNADAEVTQAKCFEPRHGIRLVAGDGTTTDFVICFTCRIVHTYRDGEGIPFFS